MRHRILGRTGLSVSEIGFGCGTTAGLMVQGSHDEQRAAVARALELGINYFDTAPVYGETASEANLGKVLAELGACPVVATKIALVASDFSDIRGAVRRSVEGSLERLRLSRIALVQLHNRIGEQRASRSDFGTGALLSASDFLDRGGVAEALSDLRSEGLVDFFGMSAYGGSPKAIEKVVDSGAFDSIIVNYSMLNATAWQSATGAVARDYGLVGARAAARGMATIVLRVLEGGLLADGAPSGGKASPDAAALHARAQTLRSAGAAYCDSAAETAVRFALSNEEVSNVLIGFSNTAQIEAAARFSDAGPLPATVLADIARLGNREPLRTS